MAVMARRAILLAALVLTISSTALAAPPDGSTLQERRVYYADLAIETAGKHIQKADRACRARHKPSRASEHTPSAMFLDTLTALRRPAAPGETGRLPVPQVYAGWVRVLPLTSNRFVTIYPIYDINPFRPRPHRCAAALSRRVRRAVADRSRAFKRVVKRELGWELSRVWASSPSEGLFAALDDAAGPVVPLSSLRGHGLQLLRTPIDASGANVYELVPDGVRSVDASFQGFRVSGSVTDNVVVYHLPPASAGANLTRQIWRDSAGRVIREISGL
jgi:hypothetical protein